MNILFLTVSLGSGHFKAAEAVKEDIEQKYPGSRTMIVDSLKYANPVIDKLVVGGYLNTVRNTPQIYGMLYDIFESNTSINDLTKAVNLFLSFKMKSLVDEFKPSAVVCTHPFPLQMLSILKSKGKIDVPTLAILTDFAYHPMWLHKYTDAYIVAHECIKQEMIKKGIPEEIIYPFGIPVSGYFRQKKSKGEIRHDFGLDDSPTILLMGGSLGFGGIEEVFLSLLRCKQNIQIIAIAGTNEKLRRQLEKNSAASDKKLLVLSYTNRVSDLMEISDFIITKPGGLTISEALIKNLPIFIISPIPGQEERNAHFLIRNGAAVRIPEKYDMEALLYQVMSDPLRLKNMKEKASYIAKPNSTSEITKLITEIVRKRKEQNS